MGDEEKKANWAQAAREAKKWIKGMGYGRDLGGKAIDLTGPAKSLPFEGEYRRLVLNAAKRKLRKRGAGEVTIPDE